MRGSQYVAGQVLVGMGTVSVQTVPHSQASWMDLYIYKNQQFSYRVHNALL